MTTAPYPETTSFRPTAKDRLIIEAIRQELEKNRPPVTASDCIRQALFEWEKNHANVIQNQ